MNDLAQSSKTGNHNQSHKRLGVQIQQSQIAHGSLYPEQNGTMHKQGNEGSTRRKGSKKQRASVSARRNGQGEEPLPHF